MTESLPVLMYVDDEIENLNVTKIVLRKVFSVHTFSSPSEALSKLHELKPAVILSDLDMPKMNGIEFFEVVKQVYPNAIRVILTGKSTEQNAIDAVKRAGIFDYITKPPMENELEASMAKACAQFNQEETERQRKAELEEKAIQSQRMALLGTCAAGIFHEIRNPIQHIGLAAFAIEKELNQSIDQLSKEKLLNALQKVKSSSKLINDILSNLSGYARGGEQAMEEVNLYEIVSTVSELIKDRSQKKNISIVNHVNRDAKLIGNKAGLYQLVMNIVSNSIDAGKKGSEVEISFNPNEGGCTLVIRDNGNGIPEEIINKIFDPFFSTKKENTGTGLGLFVVKKEVERHKAEMKVESIVGKGTTFTFTFPTMR